MEHTLSSGKMNLNVSRKHSKMKHKNVTFGWRVSHCNRLVHELRSSLSSLESIGADCGCTTAGYPKAKMRWHAKSVLTPVTAKAIILDHFNQGKFCHVYQEVLILIRISLHYFYKGASR